jgi:hypothetical protein
MPDVIFSNVHEAVMIAKLGLIDNKGKLNLNNLALPMYHKWLIFSLKIEELHFPRHKKQNWQLMSGIDGKIARRILSHGIRLKKTRISPTNNARFFHLRLSISRLNNFNYIMAVESSDMSTNTQCI